MNFLGQGRIHNFLRGGGGGILFSKNHSKLKKFSEEIGGGAHKLPGYIPVLGILNIDAKI